MKPSITKPLSSQREEPRTGVVRKVSALSAPPRPDSARRLPPPLPSAPESSPARSSLSSQPAPTRRSGMRRARAWRCLEPQTQQHLQSPPPANVSVAQLSTQGERLRQSGPDEWLPDATEFVHRAALLVAQGLGFERCKSVCLQGATGVLSVADAGPTTIVGVAGPARQLSSVLRKRGLK